MACGTSRARRPRRRPGSGRAPWPGRPRDRRDARAGSVGGVAGERADPERDRRPQRLRGRLGAERAHGDGAADPLGELERLRGLGLGQEDRELLAAEPGGHVVRTHLGAEDVPHALQHRVAGEMPVRVVGLAEQVEVDHDQGERAAVAPRPAQLALERVGEVPAVVEAGLRVETGLRLQARQRQRAADRGMPARSRMARSSGSSSQRAPITTPRATPITSEASPSVVRPAGTRVTARATTAAARPAVATRPSPEGSASSSERAAPVAAPPAAAATTIVCRPSPRTVAAGHEPRRRARREPAP